MIKRYYQHNQYIGQEMTEGRHPYRRQTASMKAVLWSENPWAVTGITDKHPEALFSEARFSVVVICWSNPPNNSTLYWGCLSTLFAVKVDDYFYNLHYINADVTHGSVIPLILFLLLINHLLSPSPLFIQHFADDTCLSTYYFYNAQHLDNKDSSLQRAISVSRRISWGVGLGQWGSIQLMQN